jgi:hypothetical protein
MKKIFLSIIALLFVFNSRADEGMWLPQLLGKQVYQDMVKRGLKLTPEQLYSINQASIKDAIVIFGGGCTGEIVSDKGLIFTNHHCGYDAIASASSVEHNYLKDGFYAKSFTEEIPSEGLSVTFLDKIEDVTDRILPKLGDLQGQERNAKYGQLVNEITKEIAAKGNGYRGQVYSMFRGNQYLLYVYQVYTDIRLVGTPPESLGKYGGDTDNWEWPRHTGDFSVFRVYAGKDNQPAAFSKDNTPLKPKYFLPVSIKGFKDGDYAMIFGYPGGTNRYETSYGVKLKTDITNPTLVKLRDERLKFMFEEMQKSEATKLKLSSEYASVANYWKFFDGESKQLLKFKTMEAKQAQEQKFIDWAKGKPAYENIFSDFQKIYDAWRPLSAHKVFMAEGVTAPSLVKMAAGLRSLEGALKAGKNETAKKFVEGINEQMKNTHLPSDKNVFAKSLQMFYQQIEKSQQPTQFFEDLASKYGSLDAEQTYKKYADFVYANSVLTDESKLNNLTLESVQNDPVYQYFNAFANNYTQKVSKADADFTLKNNDLSRLYIKGLMEMNPEKMANTYPDANFSMRTSFGNVKSYVPNNGKPFVAQDGIKMKKDKIVYDYVCTMKGIAAKYKKGDYEFDLPQRFLDLNSAKNYGNYADKKAKDVVVSFITTNDITGGNSGSPVLNGKGELIGLAFDGNFEALSHKIDFDKDFNRTICVDVRYVLWCIDVYGGAKNLIDELKIMK